eukprot:scaffold116418_cov15-Prasinocladus_malaysianus.AAC.1
MQLVSKHGVTQRRVIVTVTRHTQRLRTYEAKTRTRTNTRTRTRPSLSSEKPYEYEFSYLHSAGVRTYRVFKADTIRINRGSLRLDGISARVIEGLPYPPRVLTRVNSFHRRWAIVASS